MNQNTQGAYNEWLLKWGTRPITFMEVANNNMLVWVDHLILSDRLIESYNNAQNTHIYTLTLIKE